MNERSFFFPFPSEKRVELRTLTLEEAVFIRDNLQDYRNRKLIEKNISSILTSMEEGNFDNGTMLSFSSDGTLLDGHHRIHAQCMAGIDQEYVFYYGKEVGDGEFFDIGKNRTIENRISFFLKEHSRTYSNDFLKQAKDYIIYYHNNVSTSKKIHTMTGSTILVSEAKSLWNLIGPDILEAKINSFLLFLSTNIDVRQFIRNHKKSGRLLSCLIIDGFFVDENFTKMFIKSLAYNYTNEDYPVFKSLSAPGNNEEVQNVTIRTCKTLLHNLLNDGVDLNNKTYESKFWEIISRTYNILYLEFRRSSPMIRNLSLTLRHDYYRLFNEPGKISTIKIGAGLCDL